MSQVLLYDTEIIVCKFRPPCPRCTRRMWPDRGLEEEEIFRCMRHGWWIPVVVERDGVELPLFFWGRYRWRFT